MVLLCDNKNVQGNRQAERPFEVFNQLVFNGKTSLRRGPVTNLASGFPEQKLAKGVAGFFCAPQTEMPNKDEEPEVMTLAELVDRRLEEVLSGRRCHCFFRMGERGDSQLEEMFWYMFRKTEKGWHGSVDQFQIGRYRVDAIVDCDTKIVVIELDGAAFHDPHKDRIRDDFLLNHVDAIIRVPYAPLTYFWDSALYVLGEWFPRLSTGQLITTYTEAEFNAEWEDVKNNGDIITEHWLAEIEQSFDVVRMETDRAFIYSPNGYINNFNMRPITVQHGNGRTELIDQIYDAAQCIKTP